MLPTPGWHRLSAAHPPHIEYLPHGRLSVRRGRTRLRVPPSPCRSGVGYRGGLHRHSSFELLCDLAPLRESKQLISIESSAIRRKSAPPRYAAPETRIAVPCRISFSRYASRALRKVKNVVLEHAYSRPGSAPSGFPVCTPSACDHPAGVRNEGLAEERVKQTRRGAENGNAGERNVGRRDHSRPHRQIRHPTRRDGAVR